MSLIRVGVLGISFLARVSTDMGEFMSTMTAEDLFYEMRRMPQGERLKFFGLLAATAFREDDMSHEQLFGHLKSELFSASEAAEYLEVSMPTFRRYVHAGKIAPKSIVGRNQLFSTEDLRAFKRA